MNLDEAENKIYNTDEIRKPVKFVSISEADKMSKEYFKPLDYDPRGKFSKGLSVGFGEISDIPDEVVLYGKRASLAIGGYFGDTPEEVENKKQSLITAERNLLEAKRNRMIKNKVDEDVSESLSFMIGSNLPTFASMLVGAGGAYRVTKAIGTGQKALQAAKVTGLAQNFVYEAAGEVAKKTPVISRTDERVKRGEAKPGDLDIAKISQEWALKSSLDVPLYGYVSTVLEAKAGFGEQLNIWNTPIKLGGTTKNIIARALAKTGITAASEGGTELLQSLSSTGINLIDGTITPKELPEELQEAIMSGIVGGIMGTAAGGSVSLKQARNAISMIKQTVEPVVGKEKAQELAEEIFNDADLSLSNIIKREMEIDSQLKNKHGNIMNSMLAAVSREMEGKPRFEAMTEDERAHLANVYAKGFADNILAEANFRNTTLDAVLRASDITYDNGIRIARKINIFDAIKNPEMIPPEAKQKRESLLAFIKRNGGIQDIGGDVKNMGALKQYPGLVNKNGITLDDMALSAWENGYFPEFSERPDINTLLEAIDEGLRGNHRYNEEEAQTFSDVIENYKQELDREGIDWENMTAAEIEQAVDEIPDMKSLMREAEFYEQNDFDFEYAATGMNEDERESYLERIAMQMYQLADENAQLDAENPAYDGETININGQEKTVYNSNGDRIAKSKEALENFYKWFGDSKVVDEQGRPLVVYHGTNAKFDTFDINKAQSKTGINVLGAGFYFTDNLKRAERYAYGFTGKGRGVGENNVMPVYLNIKNPAKSAKEFDADINDGIIEKSTGKLADLGTTYMVANPNQIKSTSNRGTYSESENIYYQTDNKIYSVFDLKVGDSLRAFGKVEEIDNKERKIKIGGEWYSMFMIDSEAQRGGLTLGEKESIDIDEDIDNYEVKVAKGDRTAVEEQKSKNAEYNKLAKEYYGTTSKLSETGYILTDGSLLDFSGKKFGGTPDNRSIDHREIVDALDKAGMEEFINSGNIRYLPEGDKILLSNEPTPQQYKVIERIINNNGGNITVELMNDANKWGMNRNDFYGEYNNTTINKVKRDIKAFYTGEGVREITQYFQRGKNAKGFTNITPDAYIIKLLEGADESTLPHELAHYWLSEMWNYVRSGRASEKYMQRWDNIAKYLNIRPEQTRLTQTQQEKFASSYEAYITKGNLPTPLIGSAFDDYDKWLQRVYNDYNKINYHVKRGNKVYSHPVRLTDAAVKFFQSMTTGTLEAPTLAPKDTGVAIPQEVEPQEVLEPKNEIVDNPTTYDTTRVINITEGEKGVSKVFQREAMKHADRIVDELGVSYNKINLEEQAIKASEWVQNNLEEARKVIDGAAAPEGIIDTAIFIAYENEMLRIGNNAEYQRALKIHSQVQTQRGQAIAAERISTDDVYNPAYWWKKLQKSKETQVAQKLFKGDTEALNKLIESETKNIMKEIAGKPKEQQVEALTKLAEKLQKDYNLETLYQMPDDINERTVREFIKDTIGVNPDVMAGNEVINKAEQLQKLWENTKDKSGNPSVEAMRAKRELNDLIQAQTPSNVLAIWTSIFGRGVMLTSIKSPVLNIISNIEAGFTEGITRRLMYNTTEKAVDKSVKQEFSKYAWEVYKASADIVTTMNDYDDDMRIIGEQILHSQGQGRFRAASRAVEEVSFKYLMGAPDAVAKTLAFNDTADLLATKIAKEEGAKDISKRATEIYKDAILIRPETEQGQRVREQAQQQAHYTTFTNDSWAAKFGLSARNWLNMVGRNKVRLGDLSMKFVKTPANVSMMGLEYGFGSLYTLYHVQDIIKNPQSETSQIAIRAAVRNGLGIALAALLYSMLDPDDYFSEFDTLNPKEKDRMRALNAMPNSIKIGNRWVSLDYFGQLAIPLVGMLEAKRNNGLRSYIQSGFTQAAKIPGIKETKQLIDSMSEYARYDLPAEKIVQMMAGTVLDQARAMTIPAIVNDIAKMTDDYERDALGGVMDRFMASIPGLRQKLPERYGLQGVIRTEPALSTLFFGSRVKTGTEDRLVREVGKLSGKGEQPSISDVTKYGDLRLLSPEKKVRVRKEFYKQYNAETKKLISTRDYQNKSPEAKKKALNKVRSNVVKSLKQKYSNDIQREKRRR